MKTIEKKVLVTHSAQYMFELVNNIEHYPAFLPWCSATQIHERQGSMVVASLFIDYFKVKQHFTTRNIARDHTTIDIALVNGPFKRLEGKWHFKALGPTGCKIEFSLQYQFASKILESLIGPVFEYIASSLVDAFIKEADRQYGDE